MKQHVTESDSAAVLSQLPSISIQFKLLVHPAAGLHTCLLHPVGGHVRHLRYCPTLRFRNDLRIDPW